MRSRRTGLAAAAVAFYLMLLLSGANDIIADKFQISLNAMIWAGASRCSSRRRSPTI